jgi:hypothetical protein
MILGKDLILGHKYLFEKEFTDMNYNKLGRIFIYDGSKKIDIMVIRITVLE